MVKLLKDQFASQADRILYLQKSYFIDSMVKLGIIREAEAERELARLVEKSLQQYELDVPKIPRSKIS